MNNPQAILRSAADSHLVSALVSSLPMTWMLLGHPGAWTGFEYEETPVGRRSLRLALWRQWATHDGRLYSSAVHYFPEAGATRLHDHRFPFAVLPLTLDGSAGQDVYSMAWERQVGGSLERGEEMVRDGVPYAIHDAKGLLHTVSARRGHLSVVVADVTDGPTREGAGITRPLDGAQVERVARVARDCMSRFLADRLPEVSGLVSPRGPTEPAGRDAAANGVVSAATPTTLDAGRFGWRCANSLCQVVNEPGEQYCISCGDEMPVAESGFDGIDPSTYPMVGLWDPIADSTWQIQQLDDRCRPLEGTEPKFLGACRSLTLGDDSSDLPIATLKAGPRCEVRLVFDRATVRIEPVGMSMAVQIGNSDVDFVRSWPSRLRYENSSISFHMDGDNMVHVQVEGPDGTLTTGLYGGSLGYIVDGELLRTGQGRSRESGLRLTSSMISNSICTSSASETAMAWTSNPLVARAGIVLCLLGSWLRITRVHFAVPPQRAAAPRDRSSSRRVD